MKTIFFTFSIFIFVFYLSAGELENARKTEGKTVITCSPDGKNGGQIPIKALSALKKGMTLMLLPGEYESEIIISTDKVIITSDQSGKCDVSLQINGKDCLVKNIWLHRINADGDTIVVDSIVDRFHSGYQARRKLNHALYNTGIGTIRCGYRDTKIKLQNCTVVSNYNALDGEQFSKWTIENCILFSNEAVFEFDGYGNKKCKLSLRDNLIFGKTALAKKEYTNSTSELPQALNLKDLKKMASVTLLGENIVEQPVFERELKPTDVPVAAIGGRRITIAVSDHLRPGNFKLKPDSPGKNKGIIISDHPFLKEKTENKPSVAAKEPTPEEKKKQDAWDKEWDKIAKEASQKKDKPKSTAKKEEEPGLGGVPVQPK